MEIIITGLVTILLIVAVIVLGALIGLANAWFAWDIFNIYVAPFFKITIPYYVFYGIMLIKGLMFFKHDPKKTKDWGESIKEAFTPLLAFFLMWCIAKVAAMFLIK